MRVQRRDRLGGAIGPLLAAALLSTASLASGNLHRDLFDDLYREIFREAAGVELPSPFAPSSAPAEVEPERYVGRYERAAMTTEVFAGAEGLRLRATTTGPLAELMPEPVHEFELLPVRPGLFALRSPGESAWTAVTFYELEDGSRYVHYGARANPLVDG